MSPHWLVRMARWARHPPPASRVILVLAVVGLCALLYAVERLGGLPDWMGAERLPRTVIR